MTELAPSSPYKEMESFVDPHVKTILRSLAPEEIDMLRDAFIFMDKDSDGYVNREEMMQQVASCVGSERFGPLHSYLGPLFTVADKDQDGKLSLTEFLMSFSEGPGVVPAEVVNGCVADIRVRLTDEEISALQESFRRIDSNGDGFLDQQELEVALRAQLSDRFPELTEQNYREIVTVVMASADADQDGKLCLSEFIRSFQEDQGVLPASFINTRVPEVARELTQDEANVLREAFAVLDKNNDGYVDFVDIYNALWEAFANRVEDKSQIQDLCDLIMATADRRKSGRLTVSEFILGFMRNMEFMQIPVAIAQEKVQSACSKLQQMHDSGELSRLVMVFEDLDSNGDGYLDRSEMVGVLTGLFQDAFPEWDAETLQTVMSAIVVGAETHNSGRLSLEEFIRSFVEGPGIIPPEVINTWEERNTPRPASASDEDLQRISDALRELNATADSDGCVRIADLHAYVVGAFPEGAAKGEDMYQYVLSRFVNVTEDGRASWNENVQIEEVSDEEAVEGEESTQVENGHHHETTAEAAAADESDEEIAVDVEPEEDLAPAPAPAPAPAYRYDAQAPVAASSRQQPPAHAPPSPPSPESPSDEEVKYSKRRWVRATSVDMRNHTPAVFFAEDGTPYESEEAAKEHTMMTKNTQTASKQTVTASSSTQAAATSAAKATSAQPSQTERGVGCMTQPSQCEKGVTTTPPRHVEKSTSPTVAAVAVINNKNKNNSCCCSVAAKQQYLPICGADGSIFEEELRQLFMRYDRDKLGYLDRSGFKQVYMNMEQYGVEPSQSEIDNQFTKYARGSNKIFFDEFCVLMLHRVSL